MLILIKKLNVPKVVLRYIMINFLDLDTIKNVILNVKEMNILDDFSKELLSNAKKGFIWNCENGHINVAQWLYSLGDINIHANNEHAFRGSCMNGHINVAQWLWSLGSINIHTYDEDAFRCSCNNGHINVAQWLYSLGGINIHADNEYAFSYSTDKVLKWLNNIKN